MSQTLGRDSWAKTAMRAVVRAGTVIERTTGAFCVFLFAGMTVTALVGVFFRYVMSHPFQWTEEVARYTLIWLGFTAINMALWRGEHITIPFVTQKLPPLPARLLATVVDLLIGWFLILLLVKGWRMTTNTMMTAQSMKVSMFWFYLAVPVSAGLSLAQLALGLTRRWLERLATAGGEG